MAGGGVQAPHGSAEGAGADRAIGTAPGGRRVTWLWGGVDVRATTAGVLTGIAPTSVTRPPPPPATGSTAPMNHPPLCNRQRLTVVRLGPQQARISSQRRQKRSHETERYTCSTLAQAGAMSAPLISRWPREAEGHAGVLPITS
jgi:hypothetical protein